MIRSKEELRAFYEGTERTPDHLLVQWTTRLLAGERGKAADGLARAILNDFILRQQLRQPHSAVTLDWLADVLGSILDHHAEPLAALGLSKRAKHRPADPQVSMDVAWWVRLTERRGYTAAEAKEMAAALFHRDVKTVEADKRRAAGWVDGMNPDPAAGRDYFMTLKPPRPLPKPKREK